MTTRRFLRIVQPVVDRFCGGFAAHGTAAAMAFVLFFCLVSTIADQTYADGDKNISITNYSPERISLDAGQPLVVTCEATSHNIEIGSFMFRSRIPATWAPPGLTRRTDGYVFLAEPAHHDQQDVMCLMDNGPLDREPAMGRIRIEVSTKDWLPGVYAFIICAHNRPTGGPYVADRRPVVVTIRGKQQLAEPSAASERPQILALNVDFHCRRDTEEGFARFIRQCAECGVTRLNLRVLMMGYTEHPSKVRLSLAEADPDHSMGDFDLVESGVKYCKQFGIQPYIHFDMFDTRNDKFAADHPEFCLVSRDGKETCLGGLCLAYPEVREYYHRYVEELLDYGIEGIMFCTKSRHGMPLGTKYGFNDPTVEEFQRRHGVDVRTEKYDHEAWLDLQGEYIMSWIKEATRRVNARGGKTAVTLPGTKRNHYANLDWRNFVMEKAVNELHTSCWRSEEFHLFGPDGLKRLDEYAETCHAHGVKYTPYLFADMSYYSVYRRAGIIAVAEEVRRWVRHVRSAPVDGVLFHDMEIFCPITPRVVRDDVNVALIRAAGGAMRQPPAIYTGWAPSDPGDVRTDGEILFNPTFRMGTDGLPRCWLVRKGEHATADKGVKTSDAGLIVDASIVKYLESIPTPFPRDSKPRADGEKGQEYLDTSYRLRLVANAEQAPGRIEIRVFRYLWPPLIDYNFGHHQLHPRQAKIDEMLTETVDLRVGAPGPIELDFTGGLPQTEIPSNYLLVRLTPIGKGKLVLRQCLLKKQKQ